jgi:hypothetical protein
MVLELQHHGLVELFVNILKALLSQLHMCDEKP